MSWWFATAGETAAQSSSVYLVPETAGNLQLRGGTAHLTVTRKHTAPNLALASGTFTATKFVPVHLDAPNMQLVGGTAHFTVARKLTSGQLSLLGGTSTPSTGRKVAHSAGHLSLLGGTAAVTVARKLTSAALSLLGGTHTTTINVAEIEQDDIPRWTTDETPENLVGSTSRREPLRLSRRKW